MWAIYKRMFTNKFCKTLDNVSEFIADAVKKHTPDMIKNTCAFDYLFSGINWTIC